MSMNKHKRLLNLVSGDLGVGIFVSSIIIRYKAISSALDIDNGRRRVRMHIISFTNTWIESMTEVVRDTRCRTVI